MRVVRTAILLLVTVAAVGRAQVPAPTPIDWSEDDSARVAFLMAHGRAYPSPPIIVWAPIDSLDPEWLVPFTDSLAAGVKGLKALIGGPFTWERIGSRPVRFYLSPGSFVSHADGRDGVFISLSRVRHRDGPFLHEAAHELLVPSAPFYPFEYPNSLAEERAAAGFPFWLSEGLPDYLAQRAAAATGFPEGDVFAIGGLAKADSVCAARLAVSSRRAEIRDQVGRPGRLEALFTTDRNEVAPVYYACSQSFTAHVVARVGLPAVVALFPRIPEGTWRSALETAAGEPLENLRKAWLTDLGLTSETNDQFDERLREIAVRVTELDQRRQRSSATLSTIDSLLAFYSDSVVYEYPSVGAVVRGKAALRAGMAEYLGSIGSAPAETLRIAIGAGVAIVETPAQRDPRNPSLPIPPARKALRVLEFDEQGLVRRIIDYPW